MGLDPDKGRFVGNLVVLPAGGVLDVEDDDAMEQVDVPCVLGWRFDAPRTLRAGREECG